MEYLIGVVLAIVVGVSLTLLRMDRDRAVYPAVLIVVASYYDLFAVMGGSSQALVVESVAAIVFVALAVAGFKSTLWLAVVGLTGHGVFDLLHAQLIHDPGVPAWWPAFCLAYDITAAVYLAWLLWSKKVPAAWEQMPRR